MAELRTKLVKSLQRAHAGELAAYLAYGGHWQSETNDWTRMAIHKIQMEELHHIYAIREMLRKFDSETNPWRDKLFWAIGSFAGFMCHWSPAWAKNIVAQAIEKIGKNEYHEMSLDAYELGFYITGQELKAMAKVEESHEKFFDKLRKGER